MTSKELQKFLAEPREYGIVPFWFINHYTEEDVLRRQIREMARKHCGSVMIHPRDGLMGGYLNRHWEDVCRIIIDEAKKCGLKVWLYDELNFPSGPAGGKIFENCPDTAMKSLELVYDSSVPPPEKFDKVISFDGRYLGFVIRYQNQYPDYLNKKDMAEFVRLSYRWYADRFKEDFGSVIQGEFTDNSCANFGFFRRSVPWTENIEEKFFDFCGCTLDDVLPSLFFDTPRSTLHRLHFWRFLNALYLETFIIPIEKECALNNIAATGHYCIEDGTSEHVRQLGNRFDQKLHQQLPGVDMLGAPDVETLNKFPLGTASALIAMTSSPAYFFHDSRVLCECFGLSLKWEMNPAQMRRISAVLAALGIDLFVPHGLYYSIGGHRKRECIPDFYHNTLWEKFGDWALFAARLSALTAHSKHLAQTALFYPVTSQQASLELGKDCGKRCSKIDNAMRRAADLMISNAIPFEIIDGRILNSAQVTDNSLQIILPSGKIHTLKTVILPSVWIIDGNNAEKLTDFARSGGKIIALEETLSAVFDGKEVLPYSLPENFYSCICNSFNDGKDDGKFLAATGTGGVKVKLAGTQNKIMLREFERPDGQYFAMIQNFSCDTVENVRLSCDFEPAVMDIDTLEFYGTESKDFTHTFTYGETLLLTERQETLPLLPRKRNGICHTPEVADWQIALRDNNTLRLARMKCSYGEERRVFSAEFEIENLPSTLELLLDIDPTEAECRAGATPFEGDDGPVHPRNRCIVRVNGKRVWNIYRSQVDSRIYASDILPLVQCGKNTVELDQVCYRFETAVSVPDPFVLTGKFGIRDGKIIPCPETLPSLRWEKTSLANYSGTLEFSAEIPVPPEMRGKIFAVSFENVREFCSVFINNVDCGSRIMAPWYFEFDEKLSDCEIITLTICCTNTPANCWQEPVDSGISGGTVFHVKE